jgi:hypothetical protein
LHDGKIESEIHFQKAVTSTQINVCLNRMQPVLVQSKREGTNLHQFYFCLDVRITISLAVNKWNPDTGFQRLQNLSTAAILASYLTL